MLYHTTKSGDQIAIAQMGDTHLTNTVRICIRNLNEARKVLEGPQDQSPVTKALYGKDFVIAKKGAEATIKGLYELLPHYLFEMEIRNGVPTPFG